jgi:hypothetical protein
MRNIITLLAASLLAAFALNTNSAHADTEFLWKHFDVAPYATSREEAMRTRAEAFGCLGVTDPTVIAALVKATGEPGKPMLITNGDHFDGMLSTGCVTHKNVTVAWTKPPMKNIQYASKGEQWSVTVGNRTYVLTRPDICNNWSLDIIDRPAPPPLALIPPAEDGCLHHLIQVPYQDTLHQALYARRLLPPSSCKGFKLEHGHGKIHNCDVCTFDASVADEKAKGYLGMIQPGNTFRFTCENEEGCVLDEEEPVTTGDRIDDDIFLLCLTYPNGGRSLVEDLHWMSYHNGIAYVGYADFPPAGWSTSGGVLHRWKDSPEQREGIQ